MVEKVVWRGVTLDKRMAEQMEEVARYRIAKSIKV